MDRTPSVYLAGPISGLHFDQAADWRDHVRGELEPRISCFSPLRGKEFLRDEGELQQSYGYSPLATDRGIMTRDHFDVQRCDLVFCNLLGADRISVGTVMEIAWTFAYRKPLVVAWESSNLHHHPMVREAVSYNAETLAQACAITRCVLLRTPGGTSGRRTLASCRLFAISPAGYAGARP